MANIEREKVIEIKDLKVFFDNDFGTVQILNGISFDIRAGETLGIVGESGCGKSQTALSIMRLNKARIEGEINFEGKNLLALPEKEMRSIRGNNISMIFQDPMTCLNPVFTIGFQLSEVFRKHQGMSKAEAWKASIEALRMVGISIPEKRVSNFSYEMSGGIRQRVMIAMALACKPKLLIADEPTTALDVTIQAQVLDLMRKLRDETGTAIAFITHDLGVVSEMCDRAIVLYCGEVMEEASIEDLFDNPSHPYTVGLLHALPHPGQREGDLYVIPGTVPPAGHFPKGCVFAPRCEFATEKCMNEKPELKTIGDRHTVRCHRFSEEVKA